MYSRVHCWKNIHCLYMSVPTSSACDETLNSGMLPGTLAWSLFVDVQLSVVYMVALIDRVRGEEVRRKSVNRVK